MFRVRVQRRNLIAIAASGASLWVAGRPGGPGAAAGLGTLRALCSELGCPRSIGEACLAALPAHGRRSQSLTAAIFSFLPPGACRSTSTAALARILAEQSRKDFGAGRIVIADGWMLSRTEALLYALAAPTAGAGTTGA